MAVNNDLLDGLLNPKTSVLEHNFKTAPKEDSQGVIDTLRAAGAIGLADEAQQAWDVTRAGGARGQWTANVARQKANFIDPRRQPQRGPDLQKGITGAIGAGVRGLGKAFTPFKPVQKLQRAVEAPALRFARRISGLPAEVPKGLPEGFRGGPTIPSPRFVPAIPGVPGREKSATVFVPEQTEAPGTREDPIRTTAAAALAAPVTVASQVVGELAGSPGGLATLPLSVAKLPLAIGRGVAGLAGATKAARTLAGVSRRISGAPSAITKAVELTGKALSPITREIGAAAGRGFRGVSQVQPGAAPGAAQRLAGDFEDVAAVFFRPQAVAEGRQRQLLKTNREIAEVQDFINDTGKVLTQEEKVSINRAMQETADLRVQALEQARAVAEEPAFQARVAARGLRTQAKQDLKQIIPPTLLKKFGMKASSDPVEVRNNLVKIQNIVSPGGRLSPDLGRLGVAAEDIRALPELKQFDDLLGGVQGAVDETTAKALERSRMTLAEFSEQLPKEISAGITKEARERGLASLPEAQRQVAEELFNRFKTLADRQIAAGVAPAEAFATQQGTFIPSLFKQHELTVTPGLQGGLPRGLDIERLLPKAQRTLGEKVEAGLITPFDIPALKGLAQETYTSNIGEMFAGWATNPALVSDTPLSTAWILKKGRKWGPLDGKYVHPAIEGELRWMGRDPSKITKGVERFMNYFKSAVTVWNPPVHFGNIISNMSLMEAGGLDMVLDFPDMVRAVKSFAAKDGDYKKIKALGFLGNSEVSINETEELLRIMLKSYQAHNDGVIASVDFLGNLVTNGPKTSTLSKLHPSRIYQLEEEVGKYIMTHVGFKKGIAAQGISRGDLLGSANNALKFLFDYADTPVGVRELRTGLPAAVGAPFLTFTVKAAPRAVEAMIRRPHIFAKWHATLQGLNRASMNAIGLSDEDFAKWRQLRAESFEGPFTSSISKMMRELSPVMVFPWRDQNGSPYAADVARFFFAGQAFQPRGLPFLGAGPLTGAVTAATTGVTPFGTRIFDAQAPSEVGGQKLSPSIGTRQVSALLQGLAIPPPLLRRALVGGLSAAGPKFSATGPENIQAKLLELLGSIGAVGPRGTPLSPARQATAALLTSPQVVDPSLQQQFAASKAEGQAGAFERQFARDALRRSRGMAGQRRREVQ